MASSVPEAKKKAAAAKARLACGCAAACAAFAQAQPYARLDEGSDGDDPDICAVCCKPLYATA